MKKALIFFLIFCSGVIVSENISYAQTEGAINLICPLINTTTSNQTQWKINTDINGKNAMFHTTTGTPTARPTLSIDFGVDTTVGRLDGENQVQVVAALSGTIVAVKSYDDGRGGVVVIKSDKFYVSYEHLNPKDPIFTSLLSLSKRASISVSTGQPLGFIATEGELNLSKTKANDGSKYDEFWDGPHLHLQITSLVNPPFPLEAPTTDPDKLSQVRDDILKLKDSVKIGGESIKNIKEADFFPPRSQTNVPYISKSEPTPSSLGTKASSENACVAPTQTTKAVDENPPFTSQGNYWGHMSCMLTKSGTLEDVYSTLGPTYFAASGTRVPSYNSSRVMTVNGISSPPQITALETSTGVVTVGIPVSIDMHELGNNSYMSWGYWLQNSAMQAGGTNYYVNNRGFYLRGDPTTNAQMNDLIAHNVSGTYSGTANGTYWTNTGGANMAGSFNANVNFASRSLNNINMSISGGGHSASISGATATASGSSSTFIGNANGQWKIDGATLGSSSTKDLRGVVLGPTGKAVGGGFGMGQSPATTGLVIGIFQGTR